jgi:hypothetical protein
VSLCEGKVVDIWLEDLRTAPACVKYAGKPVAKNVKREALEKTFGGCTGTPPRIGGTFERCVDGGVYIGHGLGTFLQLRVRPKTVPFDATCFELTDDGTPIALSSDERAAMLRQTLNLRALSGFWHVTKPGRDPLRVVRTKDVPDFEFMMFGSQLVWVDEAAAAAGTAFFRVTSLRASKSRATLAFEYPVEGVIGTATFSRGDGASEWRLVASDVHER